MKAVIIALALTLCGCTGTLTTQWGTFSYQSPDWTNPIKVEPTKK